MQRDLSSIAERLFFPLSIGAGTAAVLAVGVVLSPKIAIKGSYAVIGLVLAAVIYYFLGVDLEHETSRRDSHPYFGKIVLALVGVAIVAVNIWSVERALVLLTVLPIGYTLLVVQFRRGETGKRLLAQILALYIVSPLTLYLDTDFYFSRGDSIKHVDKIETIFAAGTTSVLPTSDLYHFFPGLHLMTGALRALSGVTTYDAYMISGIASYGMLILLSYLLYTHLLGSNEMACVTALSLTMLTPILTYPTYFFPQAFAVVLVMFAMFVGFRIRYSAPKVPLILLTLVFTSALVYTHHLTLVFFSLPVAFLLLFPVLTRRFVPANLEAKEMVSPRAVPLVVGGVVGFSYWIQADVFLQALVASLQRIFGNQVVGDTSSEVSSLFVRGVTVPNLTVEIAVRSLVSPDGVYNTLLLAVFALGLVTIIGHISRFKRPMTFVIIGVSSALLMFQTPLVALGYKRARLPLSFFFVVVVAVGVHYLLNSETKTVLSHVFVVLLIVSLAVSGSLVAGDDLYAVHEGPDLGELQPTPEPQKEFSREELRSMEVASQYARQHEVPVETDWVSAEGLEFDSKTAQMKVKNRELRAQEGALLYRSRWPDHSVVVIGDRRFELVMSQAGYDQLVSTHSKVYSTGSVGILWSDEPIVAGRSLRKLNTNSTAAGA